MVCLNLCSNALTTQIMKFLVLAASLSVCSAQGSFGLVGHPNGAVTPVDEPAVAAARAEHLATKFGAAPLVGPAAPLAVAGAPLGYAATPAVAYAAAPAAYAPTYGYAGPLNLNTQLIGHPNGAVVPVDEPAVAAARAEHINTQVAISASQAPLVAPAISYTPSVAAIPTVAYAASYGYAGPLNLNTQLVAHPNGAVVPVDEPA